MVRATVVVLVATACSTPVALTAPTENCGVEVRVEDRGREPAVSKLPSRSCGVDLNFIMARSSDVASDKSYFLELQRDGQEVHYDLTRLDDSEDVKLIFERKRRTQVHTLIAVPPDEVAKLAHHIEGEAWLGEKGQWVEVATGAWEDGGDYRVSVRIPD